MPTTLGSVGEGDRTGTSTPDTTIYLAPRMQPGSESYEPPSVSDFPRNMSVIDDEDEDDASDVSMSAETVDSDDGNENDSHGAALVFISPDHAASSLVAGQKRKMSLGQGPARGEPHKRVKLDLSSDSALASYRNKEGYLHADRSLLPAEIWHHIFTFTSPRALGRLLQANKVFKAYLDPSSPKSPLSLTSLSISVARIKAPEAIWQASRRSFLPGMPSPPQGLNELDMWRLACTPTCQFCGRKDQLTSPLSTDQGHSGPGETGVSTVWPFGIRTCGSCLRQHTIKEIDLLLSSSVPSPLIVALPFIFISNDDNIISSATLQTASVPSQIQITKLYYNLHVEDIKTEFHEIRSMGTGTAEEWLKGLDKRGKEKINDAFKWERWEQAGGVRRMRNEEQAWFQELAPQPKLVMSTNSTTSGGAVKQVALDVWSKNQGTGQTTPQSATYLTQSEQPITASFSINTPPRFDSPAQTGFLNYPTRPYPQPRHDRTKEEVAELKATRRAEIERRCMLLDPPLTPAVLSHMVSFQAAIQIIKPLDDSAWEVLKPRLLSQRDEAQQRENELVAQSRVVQEKHDERRQLDVHLKEVKEVNDREWDDIQAPLRARIGGYADEIVRDGWHGGEKVTKESSPRFAADVLIYVRKRFYAEVAKDEAAARAAGHEPKIDPPNGPYTQKLILENMKFVFDTKIKPFTEQYSKDLFICNGCENNFKFYGFEGVIQHYAAKHTSTLSVGSIVVHWRAEWPENPPFNPEPDAAINSFSVPKSNAAFANGAVTSPQIHGFGGYTPVSGQTTAPTQAQQHPSSFQQNTVPYYGHPQINDQYHMTQSGSYLQPVSLQGQPAAFPGTQYPGSQAGGYQPYTGQGYPVQGLDGQYPSGAPLTFGSPHPSQVYPVPMTDQTGQIYSQRVPFQTVGQFNPGHYDSNQYSQIPRPVVPVRTEAYKAQLYDVAQTAREVWNQTAGVKDMPGSVRVYAILFHVLKRFRAKYSDDPPLAMVIDGLSTNKDMRPVRNVNGLACRACKLTNDGVRAYKSSSKGSGAHERKLFSLPQLLNHFQSTHIESVDSSLYDWTKDMVELPDSARISVLSRSQGMDDHKMQLISEALPDAFRASPLSTDHGNLEPSYPPYPYSQDEMTYEPLAPSRDNHQKFYTSESQGRYSNPSRERFDSSEPVAEQFERDAPILVSNSKRRHSDDRQKGYQESTLMTYMERRQASPISTIRAVDEYGRHAIREAANTYSELQHRDPEAGYRDKRPRLTEVIPYDDQRPTKIEHGYVREVSLPRLLAATNVGVRSNHVVHVASEPKPRSNSSRPVSHSSLAPRNQQPSRLGFVGAGSEDGEVAAQPSTTRPDDRNFSTETDNAAERFLNEFQPDESAEEYVKKAEEAERRDEDAIRAKWTSERTEGIRRIYHPPEEHHQRTYDSYEDGGRPTVITLPASNKDRSLEPISGRPRYERPSQPQYAEVYDYDKTYAKSPVEESSPHHRSPDVGEHRYRLNNTIYREDRPSIQSTHAPLARIARYGTIRVENEGPRSTSPVYVKLGSHPGQYHEQSTASRYPQQEPLYRTRTPQSAVQEMSYERLSRPEFYRVYPDEPRPRQMHHEGQIEYVQVADPKGEYLIRRPVRRDAETVYTTYEEESFPARQQVYESRPPISRSDPAYDEEYDPRHPAPPPLTSVRQVRYQ